MSIPALEAYELTLSDVMYIDHRIQVIMSAWQLAVEATQVENIGMRSARCVKIAMEDGSGTQQLKTYKEMAAINKEVAPRKARAPLKD